MAIGQQAQCQLGRIQHQLVQLALHHRLQAQRHMHFGQVQRGAALRVVQFDIAQLKRRHPTRALGRHTANANGNTQGLPGKAFDGRAKFSDSRHNPKMQRCPGQAQDQPGDQQAP